MTTVVVTVPLEPELLERIRSVNAAVEVVYEPELLARPRFIGDLEAAPPDRSARELLRFRELLARADVLFALPDNSPAELAAAVRANPRLRWVQGMAAGTGQQLRRAELTRDELARVLVTSSSGVHAKPLAEFCLLALLAFTKDLPRLERERRERRWDKYPVGELGGRTLLVVGLGAIGREVARLAHAFGMRVLGIKRRVGDPPPGVDAVHAPEELRDLVGEADAVVVTLPLTDATRDLVDRETIEQMKPGATFVNVGRGEVVDENALIDALRSGRLAGAALDVFATEPVPPESPLWELENVILSPHTIGLSQREAERIVDLFCENLSRFLAGDELLSLVDPREFY